MKPPCCKKPTLVPAESRVLDRRLCRGTGPTVDSVDHLRPHGQAQRAMRAPHLSPSVGKAHEGRGRVRKQSARTTDLMATVALASVHATGPRSPTVAEPSSRPNDELVHDTGSNRDSSQDGVRAALKLVKSRARPNIARRAR